MGSITGAPYYNCKPAPSTSVGQAWGPGFFTGWAPTIKTYPDLSPSCRASIMVALSTGAPVFSLESIRAFPSATTRWKPRISKMSRSSTSGLDRLIFEILGFHLVVADGNALIDSREKTGAPVLRATMIEARHDGDKSG